MNDKSDRWGNGPWQPDDEPICGRNEPAHHQGDQRDQILAAGFQIHQWLSDCYNDKTPNSFHEKEKTAIAEIDGKLVEAANNIYTAGTGESAEAGLTSACAQLVSIVSDLGNLLEHVKGRLEETTARRDIRWSRDLRKQISRTKSQVGKTGAGGRWTRERKALAEQAVADMKAEMGSGRHPDWMPHLYVKWIFRQEKYKILKGVQKKDSEKLKDSAERYLLKEANRLFKTLSK